MNWDLMIEVVMSMVFFAPLLIALGVFLFMGVLVLFEGAVALGGKYQRQGATRAPAAAAGPMALGLEEAIDEEVKAAKEPAEKGAEKNARARR